MLCDELIADRASASEMVVDGVLKRIAKAHKFVLGTEFAAVADALSEDYSGLVRAFEHCRLPYAETWIEVAQSDRPNFLHAQMHAPGFQVPPKRVGFLLSATRPDLSAWKAHLFWSLSNGQTSAAALAIDIDMTAPITGPVELLNYDEVREAHRRSGVLSLDIQPHPGWEHANESVRQVMLRHTNPSVPDYDPPHPHGLPFYKHEQFYRAIGELARADWAGEVGFLLAVIGLLCARNTVDVIPSDFARLNRARAKRGVPPLFEHKVLRIAHRHVKRVYPEGSARADHAPMRGHFVRGHFKVRKSGVFFWTPHARGEFSRGRIEKDYAL